MFPGKQSRKNIFASILIALLTFSTFFVQYACRAFDDNRLTSWQWAFADADLVRFAVVLICGIAAAYFLSRLSSGNHPASPFYKGGLLFLLSFAVSAVFWGEPELLVDASRYFTQAKHLELYGIKYFISEWGREINAWTDLPLMSFFYGLIFRIFGEARIYIEAFTTFLFSMTVVLTCLTGKKLWDEETGFLAGLLLLGIPYFFPQVPLMLVDVPTMFFLMLSIFTFINALSKGGIWVTVSSIAIFCAVFSKYSTWVMLSVLPVIFLVQSREDRKQKTEDRRQSTEDNPSLLLPLDKGRLGGVICRGITVFFIAGLLIAIMVWIKYDVIFAQIKFLREYQAPGLRRWGESFVSTFLFQVHPFITLAAVYSVFEAIRKRDLKFIIVGWLLFLIILLQIRRARYVMVAFPMLTLMASYGLQKIKTAELRRFTVYCVVAASLTVAIAAYLPFLQKMNLVNIKDAGEFLNSIEADRIEAFTIPATDTIVNIAVTVPMLDMFTDKDIKYNYDASFTLPFEQIKESALRFTWEYRNPRYYEDLPVSPLSKGGIKEGLHSPVVVISNGTVQRLPGNIEEKIKGHKKAKVFDSAMEIFSFEPVVTIYTPQ
ncbi:MAG: glycosyltransferase family 39 protein [Nitrospirae bacterium]|nr:glycosyltransferase family 39 protein [Nitrospirota bacterium]